MVRWYSTSNMRGESVAKSDGARANGRSRTNSQAGNAPSGPQIRWRSGH